MIVQDKANRGSFTRVLVDPFRSVDGRGCERLTAVRRSTSVALAIIFCCRQERLLRWGYYRSSGI
jgi:hypothetical protein